jgi:SagB-type dehydrogenase family enzyme
MNRFKIVLLTMVLGTMILLPNLWRGNTYSKIKTVKIILPQPRYDSKVSVEEALSNRRSIRSYTDKPVTLKELSQLLWAAQGKTEELGGRTAPSAGAKYPLEIFAVVGDVKELNPGIYRYDPADHSLEGFKRGDLREKLTKAAIGQPCIKNAPVDIVVTGVYSRTEEKYGERAPRYVHMEAGHACQNIYLQAEALDLGTVVIGSFHDEDVAKLLNLKEEKPLAIMPVGKKK